FFQAEGGIRVGHVTGVQTCTLPISGRALAARQSVPSRHEVLELTLDVGEQRRGTEPEQIGAQPALAQLFLHEDEPVERLFRLARSEERRVGKGLILRRSPYHLLNNV